MTVLGGILVVEVPVVSGAILGIAGTLIRRELDKRDRAATAERTALNARLNSQDEKMDANTAAMIEQSRALEKLLNDVPKIDGKVGTIETHVTDIRIATAALKATVDALTSATIVAPQREH